MLAIDDNSWFFPTDNTGFSTVHTEDHLNLIILYRVSPWELNGFPLNFARNALEQCTKKNSTLNVILFLGGAIFYVLLCELTFFSALRWPFNQKWSSHTEPRERRKNNHSHFGTQGQRKESNVNCVCVFLFVDSIRRRTHIVRQCQSHHHFWVIAANYISLLSLIFESIVRLAELNRIDGLLK